MKTSPKIGTVGEERIVVDRQHIIEFAGDGMPEILCTPALVALLERAARVALLPNLEPGEHSVGVSIDIEHTAPTPRGAEVVCTARVIHVDGLLITFQLEAHDAHEKIAGGIHKRRIIQAARLAKRVISKHGDVGG